MNKTNIENQALNYIVGNLSHKLGMITSLIGFVVLIGWIFNIPFLTSIIPGLVTMKVNTALGFLLGGTSLVLWHQYLNNHKLHIKFISQILALILVIIGLLTLIQYSFNINLGIDQILIKESENAIDTFSPGRMSPNTAICFFWLGLALIFIRFRLNNISQTLACLSFLIALLGFSGYIFGIRSFYYLEPFTGMALHTSISFLLLSLGILLSSSHSGWMQVVISPYMGGTIARNLLPLVIIVPLLTSGLFLLIYRHEFIPMEVGFLFRGILNIFILGGVVWWNAKYLNQLDKKYHITQTELQEYNDNLETRVHQRTQELEFANQALGNSRNQLSTLINTLPGIVFSRSLNYDYPIQYLSDGYLSIIGECGEEICSLIADCQFQNLIVTEDFKKIVAVITKAINEQTAYEVEYRIHTPCGKEKWLWEKGIETSVNGESNIQGFITEITSLKQTQAALKESENRFRELAENIEEVFYINAADLKQILYISPGYEKIWGDSCERIYQNPQAWINFIHSDDQQRVLAAYKHLLQGQHLLEEYRIIRADGSIRWICDHTVPVYNRFGNIFRYVGVASDITERKLAEIALKHSEERYRSLIQVTAQVTWTTDGTGQFMTRQESWEAFTGKSFAEYQGWNWKNSIHPDDQEHTQKIWLQAVQNRNLYVNETRVLSKTGEYKYFWVRAVPVLENDGSIREWVGACTDITAHKQAELEIKKLNQELEERVQQRTAQLTAANQELEAFSYSVSHDLRAPLRGIDGFSKTLLERYADQLDDRGKHYLTRIRAGSQRMGELIDDLLQLSRVTRSEMRFTQVNLSAIAQEIAQNLSESEPERQVEWLIDPDLIVQGDANLLRIVLDNLLHNAWKFTSKKLVAKITLNVFNSNLETKNYITYMVRDNGAGFDQNYANKLFQAFQRLHSVEEFPGTGIGLATVQRIIRRHEGDVWAEGVVGEGAAFYFTLKS
jgi:PAS domain S-box-containing protein